MISLESRACPALGLQLDRMRRRVRIDGRLLPKPLSRRQFGLLEFLAARAGQVCLREETSRVVYGERNVA